MVLRLVMNLNSANSAENKDNYILLPGLENKFEKIVEHANSIGLAGKKVKIEDILIDKNVVRIKFIIDKQDSPLELLLFPPHHEGTLLKGKWFSIHGDPLKWNSQIDLLKDLNKILEETFSKYPWKASWVGDYDYESTLSSAMTRHIAGNVPLEYILIIVSLMFALLFCAILSCVKEKI